MDQAAEFYPSSNCRSASPKRPVRTTTWGTHPSPTKVRRRMKMDSQKVIRLENRIQLLTDENSSLKKSFPCPRGVDYLLSKSNDSDLTEFIRRQDQGGLLYPSDEFISIVVAVSKLFEEFWPLIREWKGMAASFSNALLEPIRESGRKICGCESVVHSQQLQYFLIKYLSKIHLQNKAKILTEGEDRPNCKNKPLSRKTLKLS